MEMIEAGFGVELGKLMLCSFTKMPETTSKNSSVSNAEIAKFK
jgi:hypothetical protein